MGSTIRHINCGHVAFLMLMSLPACACLIGWRWVSAAEAGTAAKKAPVAGLYLHMSWSKPIGATKLAIQAASKLGYDFIVLEIGGNIQLDAQSSHGSWTKAEVKELLALAHANHLEVIPCASLLGHPECTPSLFRDNNLGMKLWETGVYEFIEKYVAELCDLFGKPRYFHARMDESGALIAECSKRLGATPAEFLAEHIKRIDSIVKRQGARLIIFHDMLLPAEQVRIGTALGGAPLNSWKAVDEIPRDVIINFWLYDFLPVHGYAVEFFTKRGFEVWLSPWLSPEPMCRWAAERSIPILQTIWCDTRSLQWYEANLRAVVLGVAYRTQPDLPDRYRLPFDPLLKGGRALNPPEPHLKGTLKQLALPSHTHETDANILKELPKDIQFAGRQWQLNPIMFYAPRESLDDRLKRAKLPLKVILSDGTERVINGINRGRGERELILYTPAFGHHTATNMFGGEASIVDNIVQDRTGDVWSGSGLVIPPGGCVISGHCSGDIPEFMEKIQPFQPIRITDADGAGMLSAPSDDRKLLDGLALPVSLRKPAREIWILHATVNAMAVRREGSHLVYPLVGEIVAETAAGVQRFPMRYARHLACMRLARWLLNENGEPPDDTWLCYGESSGYGDMTCLWATRCKLDKPVSLSSVRIRPSAAGAAAGWLIAAIALLVN